MRDAVSSTPARCCPRASAADDDLQVLREWVERERPVAVGEIGLDHFVPGLDPERQRHFFVAQLKIAREFDLPVLLHVRRAVDDILRELRTNSATPSVSSSAAICRLRGGWVMCSWVAARPKCSVSASATK